MTLLLTRGDVRGLVPMRAVIDAVETAHRDMSNGIALQPAPGSLSPSDSAAFIPMVALADRQQLAVVKFLADIPANRERGLPTQRSIVSAVSQDTGECVALIDGMLLTRQRTAAASAVASRHLARPDSKILGLIGAGGLAEAHVVALKAVLPIEQVVVWSRSEGTVERFLANVGQAYPDLDIASVPSPRDVVMNSDVV